MGYTKGLLALSMCAAMLVSCSANTSDSSKDAIPVDLPIVKKVTKETYMNGRQFCEKYVNTSDPESKEMGKWIDVPFDYANPSKKIKIYAYTKEKFNPSLPSYIYIDGGPGQNTHTAPNILKSGFNEIRFDQRGLGCSAPETWEEYSDQSLYSSMNIVQDIEEIRKAYRMDAISVYGISFGTIPATMYAHYYGHRTRSLTLEGVVGQVDKLSRLSSKVEKYNLILASLNSAQKEAFETALDGFNEKHRYVISQLLNRAGYMDGGFRDVRDNYFKRIFPLSGGVNEAEMNTIFTNIQKQQNPYDTPQHPGAVDENVLTRFFCKELGGFSKEHYTLEYSRANGFSEKIDRNAVASWKEDCAQQGITPAMENTYDIRQYRVFGSIYYLQGSHDGATIASGALSHWKTVAQGKSYFLLSLKGGHNPGLTKLSSTDDSVKRSHQELYTRAFLAEELTSDFIEQLNLRIRNTSDEYLKQHSYVTWRLLGDEKIDVSDLQNEFGGLRRWKQ